MHRQDPAELIAHLAELGVGWVKVQVSWKVFQPDPDRLDEEWWGELDALVTAAEAHDIRVLLSVAKAPEWTRLTTEEDGPPAEFARFGEFMHLLASRYVGRVAAYELWNEANLAREWRGLVLDGWALASLIQVGAEGVRSADPNALIIMGAPAPTGIDDGNTAVDDRRFFQQMVDAGVGEWVDGFGVHPYGWANPPASTVANPDPLTTSHNDHPSFFFLETLEDYRAILVAAGVDKPLWATEFGWATFENIGPTPAGLGYMDEVSEWQQAEYTLAAFGLAQERPWVARSSCGISILHPPSAPILRKAATASCAWMARRALCMGRWRRPRNESKSGSHSHCNTSPPCA
ncbi:MAG: cellulase family glycosylhydrolase [Chloroflexi bacterium]|nr:cellulase family glycosylhydrolase [Chloroflexota bacterium]